jgi:hypothetical protein
LIEILFQFLFILSLALLIQICFAQWAQYKYQLKDSDDEKDTEKTKPYDFNEAEMTAIQAIVALREVIGELLQKVGLSLPSLASIITRSDVNSIVKTPLQAEDATVSSKAGGLAVLLRGIALSLPLLIPMATTIRRMSNDPYVPPLPFLPDPYYNAALHRRRGRSLDYDNYKLKQLENILLQIDSLSRKYNKH